MGTERERERERENEMERMMEQTGGCRAGNWRTIPGVEGCCSR